MANATHMAVQCAKCGEELMGAVNRCWRCGQEFEALSSTGDLPPIRRSPQNTAPTAVLIAELSDAIPELPNPPNTARSASTETSAKSVRRGSPFGDRGTAVLEQLASDVENDSHAVSLQRDQLQQNGGAAASAILTLPIGLISFAAAFLFPLAGILLSLLGLGFGVWGINSRRRGLAVAGLLLCCASLAIAAFYGIVDIYVHFYGVAPWESESSLR
ncbi:MAG: hypothetical protein H8E66_19585 [Planctomycetes bacterium]|nr:hypothetical protein [Planctomycetota bacterium]